MSFLRKAALVNGTTLVCFALGILQTSVLSRVLGPDGVGQYVVLLSALTLTAQLFSLSFPMSFLYYSQHDPENTKKYLMNSIWSVLVLGSIGGISLVTLICLRPGYFGVLPWFAMVAVVVCVPIMLQKCITRNSLLIKIEARRLSFISLTSTGISVGLTLILSLLGLLSVGQALACFVLAEVIRTSVGWFWMKNKTDFSIKPSLDTNIKLGLMGIRLGWSDLMVLLNGQVSILCIKYLLADFENVGYYSRGERIAMLIVTAGEAIFPLLFSRWASLTKEVLVVHVEKVLRFVSSAGLVIAVLVLLAGKWIILVLYGRQFLPALTSMMIVIPGAILYLLSNSFIQLLSSRGSPELSAVMLFVCAITNAILCWLLIPVWGINGAALAMSTANVVLLTFLMVTVKVKHGIRISRCLILTREDIKSIWNTFRPQRTAKS